MVPDGGGQELAQHKRNALVFNPRDPESLAEQVTHLISLNDCGKSLSFEGLRNVQSLYDKQVIVDEIEYYLASVLKKSNNQSNRLTPQASAFKQLANN